MAYIQIPTCGMKMDVPTGSSSVLSNQVSQLCGESSDSELKRFLINQSAPLRTVLALAIVLCDSAVFPGCWTAVMRRQGGRSNPHRPLTSNDVYPR